MALRRNDYPLFENFDLRMLSHLFKDTEEDWAIWVERIGTSDGESDDDLAVPVEQFSNCDANDVSIIVNM